MSEYNGQPASEGLRLSHAVPFKLTLSTQAQRMNERETDYATEKLRNYPNMQFRLEALNSTAVDPQRCQNSNALSKRAYSTAILSSKADG